MSSINLARRRLALAGAAVLAVSAFNTSAQVLVASPDGLIRAMSEDLIRVIKADRRLVEGDLDQLNAVVDERVMPSVDFSRMTALTVGIHWRRATPEQQRQLMAAFRELLLLTYADALRQVQNASVDVKPGRYPADADDVIVRTQVIRAGKEPIQLDYRLSKTAQGWKIYDFKRKELRLQKKTVKKEIKIGKRG
jgi:phospholipid transport system substrate-binding protein